ncbi:EcoAI/FtnUII family type I restriction enzme subunit R [Paracoccus sanguinis]|uniref:Type I restriction enzyme, R subunit n=1 Tax=Paracoccus sanguinis TaxID=1545044 RepID=A0A1H2XME3_9RHOB|nr:type I restriction endonuclease subunit R [Paracoccus sanguinis]KGJ19225.1 restriction endonuclease subunit R [Paracoccus sanguinis]SDW93624.1 type I restriction enzyme, R subunit [Paracoccus sanguinis]
MTETEADTRANRIDPVLRDAGWGVVAGSTIRRELICPGRITGGGGRAHPLSADYVLSYKGRKLAVIEAKRAGLGHTGGVGQAKDYARRLQTRFAFSTNGLGWYGIDMATGAEGDHALPFPSPEDMWQRCFPEGNDWREGFGGVPFETGGGKWEPRYYQHNAITAVLEAIARDRDRILLTLATGTGKTSIAFQIAWKLFHVSWNLSREPVRRPRILFLADRNILADQAYNAFSAFPSDALCRISPDEIRKQGKIPKNASVFFTIFQTFMTGDGEFTFQGYPPDFFDLIIIDECHRGGANDESTWRGILEYFAPAVQLGLTATPKRDANADTYAYFGEPVYTYALKEGINDGFLTPFKVRQMASTLDSYKYSADDTVLSGEIDLDREYREADFNTRIIIDEREMSRVNEFMDQIDQRQKTLVFCATQDHAARVRNFINQVKDNPDPHYCERVTADDGKLGEQHLREFQDNEKTLPTVLTTSHKLSTGVDARNVRNIVLMRPIKSMIEFKQIIGRGTRTFDGKDFFTIYDFVKAYQHFNDPEWDGEPLPPEEPEGTRSSSGPSDPPLDPPGGGTSEPPPTIIVKLADGKNRHIRYIAATTYWSHDGHPITANEFMEQLFGDLGSLLESEDDLRRIWSDPERREAFMRQLSDLGYDKDRLSDMQRLIDAPNSDIFDVLGHVRFALAPLARSERAEAARATGLSGYEAEMREFLNYVLGAYEAQGINELAPSRLPDFLRIRYGGTNDAKRLLGSLADIRNAFVGIQEHLFQ